MHDMRLSRGKKCQAIGLLLLGGLYIFHWRNTNLESLFVRTSYEIENCHTRTAASSALADVATAAVDANNNVVKKHAGGGVEQEAIQCPQPFLPNSKRFEFSRTDFEGRILASEGSSNSTLVVIGANVGATETDFSWKLLKDHHGVQKILVEPVPALFHALTENVKQSGIQNAIVENVAIGSSEGTTSFYCWNLEKIKSLRLPDWFSQLCSFDRERLYRNPYDTAPLLARKQRIDPEEFANNNIVELKVKQSTVPLLMKKHVESLRLVSVVQIDTEGFDYHVVKQLPFDDPGFRPCLVVWEDVLLPQDQNLELIRDIVPYGYGVAFESQNTVLYRIS